MYSKEILDRFKNPKNVGEIKSPDAYGKVGNIACGDIMELFIKIDAGKITDIKFKTFGCAAAIASTDVLCDVVKGKTVDEALKVSKKDILAVMGDVPPVKVHCSVLATEALQEALKKYQSKQSTGSK
ncbi:MAG: iron-sulfur cluster assembly scaffold protein [Nanoarchaeota archaeon]|nr:iron-sulfur cluster assembly scaffold protein [Nanoarchaeota archaeon]